MRFDADIGGPKGGFKTLDEQAMLRSPGYLSRAANDMCVRTNA
jgi:hypothetical protein